MQINDQLLKKYKLKMIISHFFLKIKDFFMKRKHATIFLVLSFILTLVGMYLILFYTHELSFIGALVYLAGNNLFTNYYKNEL